MKRLWHCGNCGPSRRLDVQGSNSPPRRTFWQLILPRRVRRSIATKCVLWGDSLARWIYPEAETPDERSPGLDKDRSRRT
ncbi:hypothetical protein MES4922_210119 [Mesorhizobium ventifaucium]|uniref:Uncharacterized protein n=1 Tax=Mesorhizobium ventifaucium TaxID=666020 RepID=A0ABM9DR49_9HYPH|nr:hypothetical protein MES4922_210119 [Mesorhizobium ventifaucium]